MFSDETSTRFSNRTYCLLAAIFPSSVSSSRVPNRTYCLGACFFSPLPLHLHACQIVCTASGFQFSSSFTRSTRLPSRTYCFGAHFFPSSSSSSVLSARFPNRKYCFRPRFLSHQRQPCACQIAWIVSALSCSMSSHFPNLTYCFGARFLRLLHLLRHCALRSERIVSEHVSQATVRRHLCACQIPVMF